MLAAELRLHEQALTDDFQWLDAMGNEDAELFLSELDVAFTKLPQGFSFGNGRRPFGQIAPGLWERIASVGASSRTLKNGVRVAIVNGISPYHKQSGVTSGVTHSRDSRVLIRLVPRTHVRGYLVGSLRGWSISAG